MLWCLLRFSHKYDVRFIFTSSCLLEGSCLINVIVFVCKYWCPTHIVLHFCFVCFLLVLCVCYVSSFSGLSIFDCHFGICRGCCNPVFTSIFSFICMFCRSLFVLLSFFFWPLCRLLFFDILILIIPFGIFKLFLQLLIAPFCLQRWRQIVFRRVRVTRSLAL